MPRLEPLRQGCRSMSSSTCVPQSREIISYRSHSAQQPTNSRSAIQLLVNVARMHSQGLLSFADEPGQIRFRNWLSKLHEDGLASRFNQFFCRTNRQHRVVRYCASDSQQNLPDQGRVVERGDCTGDEQVRRWMNPPLFIDAATVLC